MNGPSPHPDCLSRPMTDPFGRTISYLRVSVTDRCDLRCFYCMSEDMTFLPKADLLTLEELDRLCSAFIAKGVRKLRLTGGEPLVRRNVMSLVRSLSRHLDSGALDELTLTTNGSQLARFAGELARLRRAADQRLAGHARSGQIPRHHALGRHRQGAGRHRGGASRGPRGQDQRGGAEEPQRGRNPLADGVGARQGHGADADRGDADGRHRRRPHRPVRAAVAAARAARQALHPDRPRRRHRRPCPLRPRQPRPAASSASSRR